MTDESVTTTATTNTVSGIVGPTNATLTATGPRTTAYMVAAHPPSPRPAPRDQRISLAPADPLDALRALLRTPPAED